MEPIKSAPKSSSRNTLHPPSKTITFKSCAVRADLTDTTLELLEIFFRGLWFEFCIAIWDFLNCSLGFLGLVQAPTINKKNLLLSCFIEF